MSRSCILYAIAFALPMWAVIVVGLYALIWGL